MQRSKQTYSDNFLTWLYFALFDKRIFTIANGIGRKMGVTAIFGLMSSIANIGILFAVSILCVRVINGDSIFNQVPIITGIVVLLLFRTLTEVMRDISAQRTSALMKCCIRSRVYEHLLRLGPVYAERNNSGSLSATLTDGIDTMEQYVGFFLPCLILCFVIPGALFLIFSYYFDLYIALIFLVFVPLVPFAISLSFKIAWVEKQDIWQEYHDFSSFYAESLQGLTTLKTFNMSDYWANRVHQKAKILQIAMVNAIKIFMGIHYVCDVVPYLGYGLALLYACIQYSHGIYSIEMVFAVLFIGPVFYEHVIALSKHFNYCLHGKRVLDTIEELLNEKPNISAPHTPIRHISDRSLSITFKDVEFSFREDRKILNNCSFEIQPGETVALVGASGVGKSTVFNLLYRFYNPKQGSILLDNIPIDQYPLDQLRKQFSLVSQETYLFYDTIKNNLLIGFPEATNEQIDAAAKSAHIFDWVSGLPEGCNTLTGERGIRLSGGEKQRIAIARAILKKTPILLLDEPTSGIDAESERLIKKSLDELCKDRTVLIIAHRLSTIRRADRIMVMHEGRIVEAGTHDDLIHKNGFYSDFVNAQIKMLEYSPDNEIAGSVNV
jgi:ATP-binding cassette, subfamily C, bacterial CydD